MTKTDWTLIWLIEDEVSFAKSVASDIAGDPQLPFHEVALFESVAEATSEEFGSPDFIIIDIATIGEGIKSARTSVLHYLRKLIDRRPGANYAFYSGVGEYAVDVVNEIRGEYPEMVVAHIDPAGIEDFINPEKKTNHNITERE